MGRKGEGFDQVGSDTRANWGCRKRGTKKRSVYPNLPTQR